LCSYFDYRVADTCGSIQKENETKNCIGMVEAWGRSATASERWFRVPPEQGFLFVSFIDLKLCIF
jgi:hypothetical protein